VAGQQHWKEEPDDHDYPAAESYLKLILPPGEAKELCNRLRDLPIEHFKAKDLLRASRLPLLGPDNTHVAKDLDKIKQSKRLSPVLLVRGRLEAQVPLTVADGYHRICASYHLDEDAYIPCRLVDAPAT
jgi:hypothetical protein